MRVLIDENVDGRFARWLAEQGHDVAWVSRLSAGVADPMVAALAAEQGRNLITRDHDFGTLVFRDRVRVPGLLLIDVDQRFRARFLARMIEVWESVAGQLAGHFITVDETTIRVRPLPT